MTPKQSELLAFLKAEAAEGRVPSFREIGRHMGCHVSAVFHLLDRLEERGKIKRIRGAVRSIEIIPDRVALQHVDTRDLMLELATRGFSITKAAA